MLRSYLRLVLFTLGLLLGVQFPGLINDYSLRVQAHLIEARHNLKGFNDTAGRFFYGDLQALLAHYRSSVDPVFRSDADSISVLLNRSQLLEREWQAMQGPWYARAWHVIAAADPQLRQETLHGYHYQILLEPDVIAWGLACALLLAWLVESFCLLLIWMALGDRSKETPGPDWR